LEKNKAIPIGYGLVFQPTAEAMHLKEPSINDGLLLLVSERFINSLKILF
jgi:hypothetical protein